ncbi:MAG: ABC transporter ATP-binding protein [Clostridia bacterium]|nr:ABC transporter ATP-binding protein [Clostridia bacterium]
MQSAIEVNNIVKKYPLYKKKRDKIREAFSLTGKKYHKDFEALKGVSFSVEKGECIGIIGLNGSGKSTLLKILTGVVAPTSGSVNINGRVSALLELGAGFNPEYTGIENIYLNTLLMGFTRAQTDEKLQDILDFADIGDFVYQPVKIYSSGMFVRLAFAIAVAVEPDILVIDEALSVGDVFFQQKCYNKIREFAKKSTVLIVSHDLNSITKFCSRILVMNNGVLIYDGKAKDAVTEYYKVKQGNILSKEARKQIEDSYTGISKDKLVKAELHQYSGRMDAVIDSFYYQVDDLPFGEYCEFGKTVFVKMLLRSNRPMESIIIGYQVRDKYGNEVFGETSMTSGDDIVSLPCGESMISFKFTWPEVREGDYFITLGIGEGTEVLNQVEQCWINQAIHLVNTTHEKLIYGLFNNKMENFRIDRIN